MGNKRNASIGMYYLYTFIVCVVIASLTSCGGHSTKSKVEVKKYKDVRSITVVDIYGDTIKITGGATCHLDKKL